MGSTEIKINTTSSSNMNDNLNTNAGDRDCCNCRCHRVPVTLRDTFFQDPFFSRRYENKNWDEFDKMRKDMIAESRMAWDRFNEELKKMENSGFSSSNTCSSSHHITSGNAAPASKKEESSFMSSSTSNKIDKSDFNQDEEISKWFCPMKLMRFPSLFGDDKAAKDIFHKEDQVIKVKDDANAFEVTLDTSQYRPDELKVNVLENNLSIEAKHVERSEDGSNFVSRQFVRKYSLPDNCKHDQVSSNLSSDGVLIISAPKMPPRITEETGRNVPILMSN